MASTIRVGIDGGTEFPQIEVRYQHLNVEGEVHLGSRATPSLPNFFLSIIELPWQLLGFSRKVKVNILTDVSGILKPSRLTLLLGPPESGRTTFLRALAGRLTTDVIVSGEVTYNGHHLNEFIPRKTSAYVSQNDLQTAQLTVRETLDFYGRVQGASFRYVDMLEQLSKEKAKESEIKPEDIDPKAAPTADQSSGLLNDYTIKLLGLDVCANTLIGSPMQRGVSGGQKKRVTTGEMLVGPAKAFFMDEISTGLDSSTTFQLTKTLQQIAHLMKSSIMVSLLQPAPETYALFDDVILLAEGRIVYQGPCANVMEFMAFMGFKCPERKAVADFLQEVTSRKDQRQYWANKGTHYQYVSVPTFVEGFKQFHVGERLAQELSVPYDRSKSHPAALVRDKYALGTVDLLKACFAREIILMRRNFHTYIIKVLQIGFVAIIAATLYLRTTLHHDTINNATVYEGALFFGLIFIMLAGLPELSFTTMRLPVYYKEKELFLYPSWAISIPMFVLRIPWSILEAGVFVCLTYFVIGFSPEPGRFFRQFLVLILVNQATIAMFRFAAVAARVKVAAENLGSILFSSSILLGGFVLSRNNMPVWWKWASWCSVVFYAQEAVDANEYLAKEWRKPYDGTTLGIATIRVRGLDPEGYWVWISIGALTGFTILFFVLFTLALQFINPPNVVRKSSEKAREASVAASARTSRQSSVRESLSRQISVNGSLSRQISVNGSLARQSSVRASLNRQSSAPGLARQSSVPGSRQSGLRGVMEIQSPGARLGSSPKLVHSASVNTTSQRRANGLEDSPRGSVSQRLFKGVQEIMSPARKSGYENVDNERDNNMFSSGFSKPLDHKLSASFDEKSMPGWYDVDRIPENARGMVLPFQPLSISFESINYYVDMPETMKQRGATEDKLQLLSNVTAAFRPGVLTALVGESGAGKTTLMDVLAGRKTRGYIEGEIFISGYPKRQSTFNRVTGYCEQNDIHSPNITVYESLVFSAWLRLAPEVNKETRMAFVEEVMELVELDDLRDFVVGLPGQSGLSTEQRKRLTIAVELVANPSIIFMDEPTSGLDARAAAIVMRAVRNIGDTGRTIVCTIHQPSIDIFEAFDELLLLKRGGKTIYAGSLGQRSRDLVEYFEAVPGVPKIKDGHNPAAWMLEISSVGMESKLGVNFAEIFANSRTSKKNMAMVRKMRTPAPGSQDLEFSTIYAQSFWVQCHACLWKVGMSYWRNPLYTGVKFLFVTFMGLLLGSIFWNLGKKRQTEQDIFNLMGVFYCMVMFVGFGFTMAVQPIIGTERLVYYRERGAGLYSPSTYAVAQFVIEWPYVFVNTVLFTAIAYSMIEFDWDASKVIWFWFFSCFTCLFFVHWGMIAVAATSNPQFAAILGTFPFSLFSLFSGFPITRNQMPVWWRWVFWLNPTAWSLYGFSGSQLGDVSTPVSISDEPNETITVKEFIKSYYGYEHSFLKYIVIEQVGLVLTLGIIFTICIKYLNFQRR